MTVVIYLLERPEIHAKPLAVPFPLLGSGQSEREMLDSDMRLLFFYIFLLRKIVSARDGTLGCPVDSHPLSASVTGKGFLKLSELLVEGGSLLWAGSGIPPRLVLGLPPLREHSDCAFYL